MKEKTKSFDYSNPYNSANTRDFKRTLEIFKPTSLLHTHE